MTDSKLRFHFQAEIDRDGFDTTLRRVLARLDGGGGTGAVGDIDPAVGPRRIMTDRDRLTALLGTTAANAIVALALGVEHILMGADHLAFVLGMLLLGAAARPAFSPYLARTPAWSGAVPAYALGTIAMYWTIERSGAVLGLG